MNGMRKFAQISNEDQKSDDLSSTSEKKTFNRTVQDFLTLARDHQGDSFNLEDSISDFLLY